MLISKTIELSDNKYISLEAIDATTVKLITNTKPTITKNNKKKIVRILINNSRLTNGFTIDTSEDEVSRTIRFKLKEDFDIVYTISEITELEIRNSELSIFLLKTEPLNKLTYFILPMIAQDKDWCSFGSLFVNSGIVIRKEERMLYVKVRFIPNETYNELEKRLRDSKYFYTEQTSLLSSIADSQIDIYVFKVPDCFKHDIERILEGQYSKLTIKLKKRIMKFFNFKESGTMDCILNKKEKRRKQLELELGTELNPNIELFDKIDITKECITIDGRFI